MLIVNADDWGRSRASTDGILACLGEGRVTSVSAMVFMADSERAAELARARDVDSGLHLNLTEAFDDRTTPARVVAAQRRITSFLRSARYASVVYHPGLARAFQEVCRAQCDEYLRLYRTSPGHIDGHHHMHLSANILFAGLIPPGSKVRRNFSFRAGEKNVVNRLYRRLIDRLLVRRYTCTDVFGSLRPLQPAERLSRLLWQARTRDVELMVHPERLEELAFLLSDEYAHMTTGLPLGGYAGLSPRSPGVVARHAA